MTKRLVWVDAWQVQCCGDAFAVGADVSWTLTEHLDREWLIDVLGEDLARAVTHREEHHADPPELLPPESATVTSIRRASCRYSRHPAKKALTPIHGSTQIDQVHQADGWEPEPGDLRFVGYLVGLNVPRRRGGSDS